MAAKEVDGSISTVFHLQNVAPLVAKTYRKDCFEQLHLINQDQVVQTRLMKEVRVIRCMGTKRIVQDYNP